MTYKALIQSFGLPFLSKHGEWILSNKYTFREIDGYLEEKDQNSISDILTSGMIDGTSTAYNRIEQICGSYPLTSRGEWYEW